MSIEWCLSALSAPMPNMTKLTYKRFSAGGKNDGHQTD
jgi:hypothetical protein